jgi:hypothetical protein
MATWPKPNYVNPHTLGNGLEVLCIFFAVFGVLVVGARTYSRLFITRALGFDDILIIIALGFLIALSVLVVVGYQNYHFGRHIWDIPPALFVPLRANIWASFWCYITGVTIIKTSVLLFYRRLSVQFSRPFLIATWIGIIYNIGYFVAFAMTLLLLCRPIHSYWDQFSPTWAATHKYHCGSEQVALPASSAFSVLGDLYSTVLPLVLVWHLDLPQRQKVALYALFALGFMAVASGLVRTVLLYRVLNVNYDFTRELYDTWIWAIIEIYLALIAASAPSLKPFFRHFFTETVATFSRTSRKRSIGENTTGVSQVMMSRSGADTAMSSYIAGPQKVADLDVERVGLAWAGEEEENMRRQTRFLQDTTTEETTTRHFELRPMAIQDGKKMVSMEVPRAETNDSSPERPPSDPFTDPVVPQYQQPVRKDSQTGTWQGQPLETVDEAAPRYTSPPPQHREPDARYQNARPPQAYIDPRYQSPPPQEYADTARHQSPFSYTETPRHQTPASYVEPTRHQSPPPVKLHELPEGPTRADSLNKHHSLKYKYPPRAPLDHGQTMSPTGRSTSPPQHVAFQMNQQSSQGFF